MQEDPVARRNRGNAKGPWILAGLAVVVAALLAFSVFRPAPPATAPDPERAAVTVKQRVAADAAAARVRDANRPQSPAQP